MILASGAFQAGQLVGVVILILIVVGVVREITKRARSAREDSSVSGSGVGHGSLAPPPPVPPPQTPGDQSGTHGYDQPGGHES